MNYCNYILHVHSFNILYVPAAIAIQFIHVNLYNVRVHMYMTLYVIQSLQREDSLMMKGTHNQMMAHVLWSAVT